MKFTLSIPQTDHNKARKVVVAQLAQSVTVKGFRKGKAPAIKVEEKLDEAYVTEQTVNHLFPSAFRDYLLKHKLEPIGDPSVTITSIEKDKDWVFEVEIAQKPDVTLGDYKNKITSLNATSQIILPGDDASQSQDHKQEQRINSILEILLKEATLEIPRLLIEQESNRKLSTLVKQISDMGLTVDAYLKSQNVTKEQLKQQYEQAVETNLKVDFILEAIAKDQKIVVTPEELQNQINAISDAHERKHVEESPVYQASIQYSLMRNKVVDYLLNL
jgi:FKBP-type peptidyl-prolyl cis-trans isomerase (trigger factor)